MKRISKVKLSIFSLVVFLSTTIFIACSSDNIKDEQLIANEYQLNEISQKTNLTPFMANHSVYNLSIIKNGINRFKISTESYDTTNIKKSLIENYEVKISLNMVELNTSTNNKTYVFRKDIQKNEVAFYINKKGFTVDEFLLQNKNSEDDNVFNKLISLYIELYDSNAKRLSSDITNKVANSIANKTAESCYKFESAIGATASASQLRAKSDVTEYISDGNSDCKAVGSDTSCVVDSHVCVTTVTMSCSSSCNWWN